MRKHVFALMSLIVFLFVCPASAVSVLDFDVSYHRYMQTDIVKNPDAASVEEIIRYWADALYEASNGQVLLGTVRIFQGSNFISNYRLADIVWDQAGHPKAAFGAYDSYDVQKPLGFRMAMYDVFKEYQTGQKVSEFLAPQNHAYAGYALASLSSNYIFDFREEYAVERGGKKFAPINFPSILKDVSKAAFEGDRKALNFSTKETYKDNPATAQRAKWGMSAWEYIAKKHSFPKDSIPSDKEEFKFTISETGKHFRDAQRQLRIVWVSSPVFQLVIDKSGSMDGERMRKAKNAAKDFINSLQSGVRVGIVIFDEKVYLGSPIVKITSSGNEKQSLNKIINEMGVGGATAIYDAASLAAKEMAKDKNSIYEGRYVVLFTDGEDNRSGTNVDQLIKHLRDEKISVLVMGLEEGVQEQTLRKIASSTKGYYVMTASPLDTQEMLYSYLNSSFESQISTTDANLKNGGGTRAMFGVEENMESLRITLISDGELNPKDVSFVVTPPKGKANNAVLNKESGKLEIVQKNPARGNWIVTVTNNSKRNMRVRVTAFAKTSERVIYLGNVQSVKGRDKNSVIIYASLTGNATPFSNIKVDAMLESPSGKLTQLQFQDKGYGPDVAMDDGIYSTQVDNCAEPGNYKVTVKFTNPGTGTETLQRYALLRPLNLGEKDFYTIPEKGHPMPNLERVVVGTFKANDDSKGEMVVEKLIDHERLKHSLDMARQALESNQSSSEVVRHARQALRMDPNNAEAYRLMGEAYDNANNYGEAAKAYLQAVQLEPNEPSHYYKLGQVFTYARNMAEARKVYEEMKRRFPNNKWTNQLEVTVKNSK